MKYILTNVPTVENKLVTEFKAYLKDIRFGEQYPYHKGLIVSNDHPFEALLGGDGSANVFPSVTIVSTNDGEASGMPKAWSQAVMHRGELDDVDPFEWYMSESAKTEFVAALQTQGSIYGVQHSTVWHDSTSFEIWTENIQAKNDLYNLVIAYLTGPHIIGLHQKYNFVIHSDTIRGQRSGYYNFDFGRTLYGCKIDLNVDYPIVQAVYDTDISTLSELEHSYKEVLHG